MHDIKTKSTVLVSVNFKSMFTRLLGRNAAGEIQSVELWLLSVSLFRLSHK